MLVLSRRVQQRIRVGSSIVVTVLRVSGDRVRIGIEAPQEIPILREELPARRPQASGGPVPETLIAAESQQKP